MIRENLDELDPKPYYLNKEQLREDLDLMIRNCKKYNGQDTEFWGAADTMEKFIAEIYDRS